MFGAGPPIFRAGLRTLGPDRALMKDSVTLTDQQWDLLRVLVSGDDSNGGAEFYFSCHAGGCGITYPGGPSPQFRGGLVRSVAIGRLCQVPVDRRGSPNATGRKYGRL